MAAHCIDELVGPYGVDELYIFEGHSGKLNEGMFPLDEKGYSWFYFEAPLAEGLFELNRLGFTVKQIEAEMLERGHWRWV